LIPDLKTHHLNRYRGTLSGSKSNVLKCTNKLQALDSVSTARQNISSLFEGTPGHLFPVISYLIGLVVSNFYAMSHELFA